jgi:hypothetical protein
MNEDKLTELQNKRKYHWKELQNITIMLRGLEETLKEVRIQHQEAIKNYETVDHDLALIDGRAQKIAEQTSGKETTGGWKRKAKEPVKISDLTQEQIDELLLELDPERIKEVPEPQDVELNEEVVELLNQEENNE